MKAFLAVIRVIVAACLVFYVLDASNNAGSRAVAAAFLVAWTVQLYAEESKRRDDDLKMQISNLSEQVEALQGQVFRGFDRR